MKHIKTFEAFVNESHDRIKDAMNDSLGSQVWHVITTTYDKTINNNSDIKRLVQDIKHTVDPRNGGKWHGHDKKIEDIIVKASRASNFRTDKWFHDLFINIWDEVLKVDDLTYDDDDDDMDEATNEVFISPHISWTSHATSSPEFQSSPYAIIGIGIFVAAGFASLYAADSGYFDQLKSWWKKWRLDRKINKIVERLRDDQDILDFLQLPESKQRGKWEKLLSGKLNDEEERYLKSINKKHFANEGIIESYDEFLNEAFSDKNLKDVYKAMKGVKFTRDENIPKWKTLFADFTFQNWQDMIKHWDKYGDDNNKRDMSVFHALTISMLMNQHSDIVFGSGSTKTKDGYSRQDLKDWYNKEYKTDESIIESYDDFLNEGTKIQYDNTGLIYKDMWDDLEAWCKKNKYPAWRHQKNYIKTIAPSYDIKINDSDWSKIFKRYDELHNKMYFAMNGDGTGWPWLDNKIKELNK